MVEAASDYLEILIQKFCITEISAFLTQKITHQTRECHSFLKISFFIISGHHQSLIVTNSEQNKTKTEKVMLFGFLGQKVKGCLSKIGYCVVISKKCNF